MTNNEEEDKSNITSLTLFNSLHPTNHSREIQSDSDKTDDGHNDLPPVVEAPKSTGLFMNIQPTELKVLKRISSYILVDSVQSVDPMYINYFRFCKNCESSIRR